jgi:general secretion pathway protein E
MSEQGRKRITTLPFVLSLERIISWLAEKSSQEYRRIDPLKIDVAKINSAVNQAYADNLKILPIKVTETELTVGGCEPYDSSWVNELSRVAKLNIKRVVINPVDLERYLVEFYA